MLWRWAKLKEKLIGSKAWWFLVFDVEEDWLFLDKLNAGRCTNIFTTAH